MALSNSDFFEDMVIERSQEKLPWGSPSEVLTFKENELIYSQGSQPKGLYMVKSGSVKILVNRSLARGRMTSPEFINRVVGPYEFFGYGALISGASLRETAKALRLSEIHVFPKDFIQSITNGPNTLMKLFLNQVVKDLESQEVIGQLHYLASVQERIAYQLLLLTDKFGVPTPDGVVLNLRLSRNELAQLAGTINESLSRHLTEFKNDGIIELKGKEIIIKDRHALMKRSGNFKES